MKIISSKPKRQRIFKSVYHVLEFGRHKGKKVKRPFSIEPIGKNWWFCLESGEWVVEYNGVGNMTTSYYAMTHDGFNNVYSLKAAIRLICKWNVPKGTKFRISLPFRGYGFTIIK